MISRLVPMAMFMICRFLPMAMLKDLFICTYGYVKGFVDLYLWLCLRICRFVPMVMFKDF